MRAVKQFLPLSQVALAFLVGHGVATAQYAWEPADKVALMVVNAHPDDEGIFFGGTLPYYSAVLGLPTLLVSVTSGDWYPTNLTIRENELRCAAWTYGLRHEPVFLRFRDVPSQSMAGNPYPNKIDGTWDYWADGVLQGDGSDVEAGKLKVINNLAEQIRRYRPEVIISHDPKGEYGHHNHIATTYALTNAFFVAADPSASAPNLEGLPPWQVKKLYLHLYPENRLFHRYTEIPLPELGFRTCRDLADEGLNCHVSQKMPDVSTVYRTGENYDAYPSEWWGLYASTVGPDSILTSEAVFYGYTVPAGVAAGNFLENLGFIDTPTAPAFVANPLQMMAAVAGRSYTGTSLARSVSDPNLAWGDTLTFEKLSGPAWLTVVPDGRLSGIPGLDDVGTNIFLVRAADTSGFSAETLLWIEVMDPLDQIFDLVGWWKLDDTSSELCLDSAIPSRNGAFFGPVMLGQGGATSGTGLAVRFNGTDTKVDVPYSADLNPPVFTAAVWAKVQGGASTFRSPLTSRGAVPQAGYLFYAAQNNTWQFWLGTGSAWRTLSAGPVQNEVWMHLAGTYDGTTARFYTNGVLAVSQATTFLPNSSFPLRIGAGSSELPGQYWFPGLVDDVRIYSKALNAGQVASLYSNVPPRFLSQPTAASAFAGTLFSRNVSNLVTDPGDVVRFSKVSGPGWVSVSRSGLITGIPASADVGPSHLKIGVADSNGSTAQAGFDLYVLPGRLPAWNALEQSAQHPFRISFSGVEGQTYVIEATETLTPVQWSPVATNGAGSATWEWADSESAQRPHRFYRVVVP
jgi:LmbE family N-acetylglucosaminyl deacetylase